ncbi:TonB-dependent receptor domain-containing protein [Pedobacter agri]|uniref:TonB-dependent receptor n=1 Tax=Pedobacter agri TaxID=454586 RepID=A0A9X3DC34_9SPHI|nr:TonB-dependent receptor [Pedobacter agri]MCX3264917.1 TonB-dependent receptor [Pedobacter agri]
MLLALKKPVAILFLIIPISFQVNAQLRKRLDTLKTDTLKEVVIKGYSNVKASGLMEISKDQLQLVKSTTIGETLSHIAGIQNVSFGPHSGAPMIRSLSGNRVRILSNGLSMNDLSGISPNLNVVSDMDNLLGIEVLKGNASVLYGGRAIGGAVNLLDNTIPKQRTGRNIKGAATLEAGNNAGYRQAFDLNGDLGSRWSWHAGAMNHWNKLIKIPGNTKSPIAYDPSIDHLTQTMAQVNVDKEVTRNLTLYPYISQFVIENINNPEWGLSEADLYTFQENSVIGGASIPNPRNALYIPGQPPGTPLSTTTVKGIYDYSPVTKGIMPNSQSNSYAVNVGTSYIDKHFRAGIGFRRSFGNHGIPGFALRKLPGHTHTHEDGYSHEVEGEQVYLPINTRSASNNLLMESAYSFDHGVLDNLKLNYIFQSGSDSEFIGDYLANEFASHRHGARMEINQRSVSFLKGISGFELSKMSLKGNGEQRYLPDNLSREYGIFTLQQVSWRIIDLDFGYRHERVDKNAMLSPGYTPSRGLGGGKLSDRSFKLNQYNIGSKLKLTEYGFLKGSYVHAERAPEVNELYAGNNHFAIMLEENGDDRLNKEVARTREFGAGMKVKGYELSITHYSTRFDNYLYLAHTGISRSGGFLVKEWRQADTKITGWEAELKVHQSINKYINIRGGAYFDLVKNINVSGGSMRNWAEGDYMPNMPTSRFGFSTGLDIKKLDIDILFDRYLPQRFLGKNINPEPPMPGYSLLTARVAYNRAIKGIPIDYFISGNNLLNIEARPQNSLLKYLAPLAGINISLGLKINVL